jgi:hypothetical protein
MDEILKKLLESELLSEEAKTEIKTKFDDFVNEVKEQTALEVKTQLTEEFIKAREELVESVNSKVDEFLKEELSELQGDIESFRDLEVEYTEKLLEEKEKLAVQLGEELDELVNKLDAFLEVRLSEELAELAEDIESIKKDSFGRKIFEAYAQEFARSFVAPSDSAEKKLSVVEDELSDAKERIATMEAEQRKAERARKLDELLSPLTGQKHEHMKLLLSSVSTEKLEEAFNRYIGRVLKEEVKVEEVKDTKPVEPTKVVTESVVTDVKVVTGNETIVEELNNNKEDDESRSELLRLKALAGISN